MLRTQFCLYKVGHGLPPSDGFLSLLALSLSHWPAPILVSFQIYKLAVGLE